MMVLVLLISATALGAAVFVRDVATLTDRPIPAWSRWPVLLALGAVASFSFVTAAG